MNSSLLITFNQNVLTLKLSTEMYLNHDINCALKFGYLMELQPKHNLIPLDIGARWILIRFSCLILQISFFLYFMFKYFVSCNMFVQEHPLYVFHVLAHYKTFQHPNVGFKTSLSILVAKVIAKIASSCTVCQEISINTQIFSQFFSSWILTFIIQFFHMSHNCHHL